ncbi:alpha-hydroxyketone-type quorum-sensing autoinducer synthase [Celerinatantimonas sp. YJH-8]
MSTNKKELPSFLQTSLDFYLKDLIKYDDQHLVVGDKPKVGDVVLQSNDYLSLANNTAIRETLKKSVDLCNESILMSAVFVHKDDSKPTLEKQLSSYVNFDNCLLFQSGWSANTSLLQTICTEDVNVYIDFLAHMSLWEGARSGGAKITPFLHNNMRHLEKMIKRNGPGIIIVDSVYSTVGTIAPLVELVAIAKKYNCATVIDESHSLGVYGKHGAGILDELNLSSEVDFMTASLAKTFAYRAGAVWANNNFTQCIPYVGYPAIFSSTMLPYELDVLEKTLHVIQSMDDARSYLFKQSQKLRAGFRDLGITIRSESQIISIETGEEDNTYEVRKYLEKNGVFGSIFCRPATSPKHSIIRFSVNSSLTDAQIDKILSTCYSAIHSEHLYIK